MRSIGDLDLGKLLKRYLYQLIPAAAQKTGIRTEDFNKMLKIRLGNAEEINASVSFEEGQKEYEIVVNTTLMIFYHKMLKVFVSHIGIGQDEEHAIETPKIQIEEIFHVCGELLRAFWNGSLIHTEGFSLSDLGDHQKQILNTLISCCERFDIAHELGHVIIDIKQKQIDEYKTAESKVKGYLNKIDELADDEKKEMIPHWTEEICADLIGLGLVLSLNDDEPKSKPWHFFGAEVTFLLQDMTNLYYDRINYNTDVHLSTSHPYDLFRWQVLKESKIKERYAFKTDLGKMFIDFSSDVFSFLFTKDDENRYCLR